jgi:hypothetical protein
MGRGDWRRTGHGEDLARQRWVEALVNKGIPQHAVVISPVLDLGCVPRGLWAPPDCRLSTGAFDPSLAPQQMDNTGLILGNLPE